MEPIVNAPIILDLGKASRKNIRQMKQGRGKLITDVQEAMTEVTTSLGEQAAGQQLVPVVLVYKTKRKKGKSGRGMFPVLF